MAPALPRQQDLTGLMNAEGHSILGASRQLRWWRLRGFTILEAGLGMLILLLGVVLALMMTQKIQHRARCDELITDLRAISAAFQSYHQQQATWPAASSGGVAPPHGLESLLKETNWLKGTPFGGSYGWVPPDPSPEPSREADRGWAGSGTITLTAFSPSFPLTLSRADLVYIDAQIDDGNLATGRFRTGFNGWPIFLVKADR